jgi:esterase/lipase superfamily enzyme
MAGFAPASTDVAILLAGIAFYAVVWFSTGNLPRGARLLARVVPLGLIIAAVAYLAPAINPAKLGTPPIKQAEREPARQPRRIEATPPEASGGTPPATREGRSAPHAAQPQPAPPAASPSAAPKAANGSDGAPRSTAPLPGAPAAPATEWDVVPVFYGTDRLRTKDDKRIMYSADRAHRLELGRALVTVPKSHQVPNIERPFAIRIPYFQVTVYEAAEDPRQHFTIRDMAVLTRAQFLDLARERVAGSSAFRDQAILFVHGYNTGFDYALYRTAQMAYDLRFDGSAFLYSWPSGGDFTSYGDDRESSAQTEPYLRQFIELVVRDTGAKSVSVIAHSMGNLPLLRVMDALGPSLPVGVRLNQIILAAPDVDRDVFTNLTANIRQYGRGVTLYCSSNDRAMTAARRVAGGVPRAGDVPGEGPLLVDGIDTIDISQTSTEYLALNHSTYAEKDALLNDIGLLLQTGERPPERRIPILQRITTPKGDFWRYPVLR